MSQPFEDLLVWHRAMDMSVAVYRVTEMFPKQEIYGLTSQLRRAAVSVPSNIAEGRGRLNQAEFRQFLGIAQGSNFEVQTQLFLAKRLNFAPDSNLKSAAGLSVEVGKMLSALIATIPLKAKS